MVNYIFVRVFSTFEVLVPDNGGHDINNGGLMAINYGRVHQAVSGINC